MATFVFTNPALWSGLLVLAVPVLLARSGAFNGKGLSCASAGMKGANTAAASTA